MHITGLLSECGFDVGAVRRGGWRGEGLRWGRRGRRGRRGEGCGLAGGEWGEQRKQEQQERGEQE
ncbi:MAG: hypothetical protein M5U01_40445 [Ardenticatenaceae bacterium]|nr:hypothetical protein [Ardenticatenaceae bacterium]